MSSFDNEHAELFELLEAVCENRLSAAQSVRLEQLLGSDAAARTIYRRYLTLHGHLYWDTAMAGVPAPAADAPGLASQTTAALAEPPAPTTSPRRRSAWAAGIVAAAAAVLALIAITGPQPGDNDGGTSGVAGSDPASETDGGPKRLPRPIRQPELPLVTGTSGDNGSSREDDGNAETMVDETAVAGTDSVTPDIGSGSSDSVILEYINTQLVGGWEAAEIQPSPYAEDTEWLRRVYLDLIGRIPQAEEVESFLADSDPRKRERVVDDLLERPEFIYNWSTIWANLMVGRVPDRAEYRTELLKFLRDSFRENRPWNAVVADLISAEGSPQENGASGFLLAHVNNQAVPATAITARLFLGSQVHCMQCHDHPFNDFKQNQFWALNSFFKQTAKVETRTSDPETGRMLQEVALVTRPDAGGPTFYETRQGLVRPAYPIFDGHQVGESPDVNRRQELAHLLSAGSKPQIAEALVNRLWSHFFGYGFINPVDDMGPHNAATHPLLLDRLAREFVAAGYDQKRLMRWICLSDAYQRTSRISQQNDLDNPDVGEPPLFSRVYVKTMTAEQVYDSLLTATGALSAQPGNWDDLERRRQQWLQQFVYAYGTDENDEETRFSGTITQALMLMNGDLISEAVNPERPNVLRQVLTSDGNEQEKIRRLCLAALSRYPTESELAALRKLLGRSARTNPNGSRQEQLAQGLQDIFWAYLNSSEFAVVH